ncbi:M50 family metallopeptidase [Orientia tsutsugamushi]|uniref:Putative membrane-associated zinc-dependent metalloprotease n=1 Tax=Orientia tsutsugamushi (strain Boryong) TaxID=357244 RepID=A5CCR0_ORITB|nr:M50 family metallopeptidase [Orientia tsutsugamushi]CAM79502.1 putative membrane-associated zinc-dependent metalloprotease [Orientia tsutsugamushi str. Boryong]
MFLVTTILSFVITTGLLIFVHELGHYFCARLCGVYVQEFSIGFGKELFAFIDKNLTRWKICIFPLGGFVRMQHHSQDSTSDRRSYNNQPIINRMLIVLAGPAANFIFAIVALTFLNGFYGKYIISSVVDHVVSESAAEKAGIMKSDIITEVAGVKVRDFLDLVHVVFNYPEVPIELVVERENKLMKINVVPHAKLYRLNDSEIRLGDLGVRGKLIRIKSSFIDSILESVNYTFGVSKLILIALWQKLTGKDAIAEIVGVVGIAQESSKAMCQSIDSFLLFLVNLSISLGVMNLLPILPLDGGRFLYLVYEMIVGKGSINLMVYNIAMKIGIAIIIFLIVISISNDIKNLLLKF